MNGLITEHDEPFNFRKSAVAVQTNGTDSGKKEPVVAAKAPVQELVSAGPVKVPKKRKK